MSSHRIAHSFARTRLSHFLQTATGRVSSNSFRFASVDYCVHKGFNGIRFFSDDGGDKFEKKEFLKGETADSDFEELADEADDVGPLLMNDDSDPFGVNFEDGDDKVGPSLPPIYKRDAATGRLTGEVQQELTEEDKRLLKADTLDHDKAILNRIDRHWEKSGTDESGIPTEVNKLGERIRRSNMGLNVLGRSVKAQASKEKLDDGSELGRDETGFSQPLTPSEFEAFAEFVKQKHQAQVSKEDIPVQEETDREKRNRQGQQDPDDPDNMDLSLKWLTARAQRQMDELVDDDPYSDLMPGDLSPTTLVNRKRAKPIPTELLHHNNTALLSRYLTPTSQIKNRVQSRLGARDQRRIAKLVKRARALGLIPYTGQFKAEQHGWIHAPDIHEERDWEQELTRRGLVIKRESSTASGSDSEK